METAEVQGPL